MCDPASAVMAASAVAGAAGQQQQADAANQAAMTNGRNANLSAQNTYDAEARRTIYDAKSAQKEGYDATLRGRASAATGIASSGDSGFQGNSLEDLVSAEQQKIATNESKTRLKQEDITQVYIDKTKAAQMQAQGRIDSMPMKSGASPLGLAIGLAGAAAQGNKNNPDFFTNMFGGK